PRRCSRRSCSRRNCSRVHHTNSLHVSLHVSLHYDASRAFSSHGGAQAHLHPAHQQSFHQSSPAHHGPPCVREAHHLLPRVARLPVLAPLRGHLGQACCL